MNLDYILNITVGELISVAHASENDDIMMFHLEVTDETGSSFPATIAFSTDDPAYILKDYVTEITEINEHMHFSTDEEE